MKNLITACTLAACCMTTQAQPTQPSQAPLAPNPRVEWATKVVALQQGPEMDRLVAQLAGSTTQDMIANWQPRLLANVPKDQQPQAIEKLNAELQKYATEVGKIIQDRVQKVSTEALLPVYMERFTVEELQQIATFLESPTIRKYQSMAPELGTIFMSKLVEASRTDVQARAKQFDEEANRIVGPGRPAAPASKPASKPAKPAAKK